MFSLDSKTELNELQLMQLLLPVTQHSCHRHRNLSQVQILQFIEYDFHKCEPVSKKFVSRKTIGPILIIISGDVALGRK